MDQWNYDDEYLSHHGIKGMHWGVRRYQRRDGSLTPTGERRRTIRDAIHDHKVKKKRKAALEKARATKQANKEAQEKAAKQAEKRAKLVEKGKISTSKMTDDELRTMMARKQLEKQYRQLDLETNTTKRFMNHAWNDMVEPALLNGGKQALQKYFEKTTSDLLGLNKKEAKTVLEKAKDEADLARYQKEKIENTLRAKELLENGGRDEVEQAKRAADLAKYRKNAYNDTRWLNKERKKDEEQHNSSDDG